jgi:hypothetical protein
MESNVATETSEYSYDVFVSYSHRDKQWVSGELLPKLEASGLHVCIDYRDFEAGAPIIEEIDRVINRSRKTLVILTKDYLESDWTNLESCLVQTNDPAHRKRKLIPLLKGYCKLPRLIKFLIPIDMTRNDTLDMEWEKLLRTLGSLPVNPGSANLPPHVTDSSTQHARQGLEALLEIVHDPAVMAKVATYRAVFQETSERIEILGYY